MLEHEPLSTKIIKTLITRSACWTVRAPLPHLVHGAAPHVAPHAIVTSYEGFIPATILEHEQKEIYDIETLSYFEVD